MFENELIWEAYILERQDREKINSAEKIYEDYIKRISRPLYTIDSIFQSSENIEKYADYTVDLDIDFSNLIRNKLYIYFKSDKGSKSGHNVGGSYVPQDYAINIYDTELKDLVVDMRDLFRKYDSKPVNKLDDSFHSEMRLLFSNFLTKIETKKSIIIHELIHYFDGQKFDISDKVKKIHSKDDTQDEYFNKYVNSFWEVNAYTLESIFKHGNVDNIEEFLNLVKTKDVDWFGNLNEKNKRKVLKRIYDYYKNR